MWERDQSLTVGEWSVEPRLNRISRGDGPVCLRPRVMDLLVYLASRPGQVVSADQLIDELWDGVIVGSGSVYNCINELRRAFGDDLRHPSYLETIPRRGYRLIARTAAVAAPQVAGTEVTKASIAVLPFLNLSSDPEQEYFSDGISEEILNVLAKIPNLQVAARMSSFQFKGEHRDITDIGRRLNVAHVVEGSVRKSGLQIRITAQLIDAGSGFHLWSQTYDRELQNIFAVQDEISAAIVDALKDHLGLEVAAPPPVMVVANIEAHEAYLRGRYLVEKCSKVPNRTAVAEFEKAVALEPDYARAHAELAIALRLLDRDAHGDLPKSETVIRAAPHAARALELDPGLAEAHAAQAYVEWGGGALEAALAGFRQAIRINPNYSIVHTRMGSLLGNDLGRWQGNDLGLYDQAFAAHQTAIRLDPLSLPATSCYIIALIARNRLDEADWELEKLSTFSPHCHANKLGWRTSLGGKWANALLANLDALLIDPGFGWVRNSMTWEFAAIGLGDEALAISQTPLPFVLSMLGRPEDAVRLAEIRLAEEPNALPAKRDLGLALAGAGDYARAGPILEELWQRNGRRVSAFGLVQIADAAALVAVRRAANDEAAVDQLLAAIMDNVTRYRQAGIVANGRLFNADFEHGLAAYLGGQCESGLALIAKAAENGFFIQPREAYLRELYDDPDFAPIGAAQEARQATERDRFLAIVGTDNPYSAVWQPAKETREKWAAARRK